MPTGTGPPDFASTWHEAVNRGGFAVYEPDTDEYRWTGSYSGRGDRIGVCGLVDGHITRVETWAVAGGVPNDVLLEIGTHELDLRATAENGGVRPVESPTIEADDRLLTVDEREYPRAGRRLVGTSGLWVGHADIDEVTVRISTTSPALGIALRICSDPHALVSTPPRTS